MSIITRHNSKDLFFYILCQLFMLFLLKVKNDLFISAIFSDIFYAIFSAIFSAIFYVFYLGFCRSINFTSHIARSLARSLTPVTQKLK